MKSYHIWLPRIALHLYPSHRHFFTLPPHTLQNTGADPAESDVDVDINADADTDVFTDVDADADDGHMSN